MMCGYLSHETRISNPESLWTFNINAYDCFDSFRNIVDASVELGYHDRDILFGLIRAYLCLARGLGWVRLASQDGICILVHIEVGVSKYSVIWGIASLAEETKSYWV
jgi:hypothetical protein